MRAKYIVVSNSSLFEAGACGTASAQPLGDWPLWPLLVKGRGLNGPLLQSKWGGVESGERTGLLFDTLLGLAGPSPSQASLELVGPS